MKRQIFLGFFKWLLLLSLILWACIAGMSTARPGHAALLYFQSISAQICCFIWDIPAEGLSWAEMQRQLSLSGMNYAVPDGEVLSFSAWFQQLPQRLLTSQLHAFAASPAPASVPFSQDEKNPAETSKTSGVNLHEFLKNHESVSTTASGPVLPETDGKKIVLYCTHNSESYIPSSGDSHVAGGQGLINQVAEHLAKQLTQKGIPSEFVFGMHDWPSYDNSYTESRKTVNQILEENPDQLLALFDVHRDSILSEKTGDTVTINHRKAAKILLVVGTDQRKAHPNWKQNLAFAQKIEEVGNQLYPGLIRGITQKAGTYHQELFTGALLLEFGTDLNSLEEAEYAAELLSDILLQIFSQE